MIEKICDPWLVHHKYSSLADTTLIAVIAGQKAATEFARVKAIGDDSNNATIITSIRSGEQFVWTADAVIEARKAEK